MKEKKNTTELCVENVDEIFADSLFRSREEYEEYMAAGGKVVTEKTFSSPSATVVFHSERLESHRSEIKEMITQIPDSFFMGKGDGDSFLNLCQNKDGDLWTGFHAEVQKLALLGLATKMMSLLLPLEKSHILPGGMPYLRAEI